MTHMIQDLIGQTLSSRRGSQDKNTKRKEAYPQKTGSNNRHWLSSHTFYFIFIVCTYSKLAASSERTETDGYENAMSKNWWQRGAARKRLLETALISTPRRDDFRGLKISLYSLFKDR